jgi:hypothetical protein
MSVEYGATLSGAAIAVKKGIQKLIGPSDEHKEAQAEIQKMKEDAKKSTCVDESETLLHNNVEMLAKANRDIPKGKINKLQVEAVSAIMNAPLPASCGGNPEALQKEQQLLHSSAVFKNSDSAVNLPPEDLDFINLKAKPKKTGATAPKP